MPRAEHDEAPPFSVDFGHFGEDLDILVGESKRLRAYLAVLRKEAPRGGIPPGMRQNIRKMMNDQRIKMRVAIETHNGVTMPRGEKRCVDYMKYPEYCLTEDYRALNDVNRLALGVDPRVLHTARRVIADAQKVGVPLWISEVDPKTVPDCVQLGHAKMRELPWDCWTVLDDWVEAAGLATGFRLGPLSTYPGEYRLLADAAAWSDDVAALKPIRLIGDERRDEAERLWTYYAGGAWVDEFGEVHDGEPVA